MTEHPASDPRQSAGLERCQAELAALRESEAAWHDIFRNAPVALSLASAADGRVREVNARYAELLGEAPEALRGRLFSELHLLPEGTHAQRIARELAEHSRAEQVRNHYYRSDSAPRPCVSSMRLVQCGDETLILSVTSETADVGQDAQALPPAPDPRVAELEAELAAHRTQERRLIGEIGELCTEAGLLRSDIIQLKLMQQQLSGEMETVRKRAVLIARSAAADGSARAGSPAAAAVQTQPAEARPAAGAAASVNDALWEIASARLQHVEEQLIKHASALREQAQHMQAGRTTA